MYGTRSIAIVCFTFLAAVGPPALAGDDHMAGGDPMASATVAATGTVNSIDAAEKKINITHEAIPALDWPGMTMDFQLGEGVGLEGIESGTRVTFQLRKATSGAYVIESLSVLEE